MTYTTYTTIEDLEIYGDLLDELREWEDFEADMATNPYDVADPTEAEIEAMARTAA